MPSWPHLRIDPGGYNYFSTYPQPPSITLPLVALPKKRIIELAQHWQEFSQRPAAKHAAP